MTPNTRDLSDDDIRYLNRYLKAGLSIQEICQRLKRRPKIILEKISTLKLEPEDRLVPQKHIQKSNKNSFSTPLVVLSSIVFLLALLLIYPEVAPEVLSAGYFIEICKMIILLCVPFGVYECGRSFIDLFKEKPQKVRNRSKAKWTSSNERLLKILADEGHSLKLISIRLGFEKDDRYTEPSIRSKLVKLNFYDRYLERLYDTSLKQVNLLTKKLGKDFGGSVRELSEELVQDNILSLLRHSDERVVELRPTFFTNPQSRKISPAVTEDAIKVILGYLNSLGGTLVIGANNQIESNGGPKADGIFDDNYEGEETYLQSVRLTLRSYLPHWALTMISIKVVKLIGSEEVCAVRVIRSSKPVLSKKPQPQEHDNDIDDANRIKKNMFFIRKGGHSVLLDEISSNQYILEHFEH